MWILQPEEGSKLLPWKRVGDVDDIVFVQGAGARPDGTIYLTYLDAFAVRVRSAGKVVNVPLLGVVGVRPDGGKQLLALDLRSSESAAAWKGCLDDLVARGLRPPVLCILDGNPGLRRAVGEVWPRAAVQRCAVHKLPIGDGYPKGSPAL